MAGAIAAILEEGRVVRQDERDELTDPCVLLIFYLPQVDCQTPASPRLPILVWLLRPPGWNLKPLVSRGSSMPLSSIFRS